LTIIASVASFHIMKVGDYLYRYEPGNRVYGRRLPSKPYCHRYRVIKLTPRGVWVSLGWGDRKWISTNRRYGLMWAYPTKEKAMESYLARTDRRIAIVAHQLRKALLDLEVAGGDREEADKTVKEIMAGHYDYSLLEI